MLEVIWKKGPFGCYAPVERPSKVAKLEQSIGQFMGSRFVKEVISGCGDLIFGLAGLGRRFRQEGRPGLPGLPRLSGLLISSPNMVEVFFP